MDQTLEPSAPRDSRHNRDYYSWGQPVVSPLAGRVLTTEHQAPDTAPRGNLDLSSPYNQIYLEYGDGRRAVRLVHMQQHGVRVKPGETVAAGQVIGLVGNSGPSGWPHLHLDAYARPNDRVAKPVVLENVEVSLNGGDSCPWRRKLKAWPIREGFFVTPLTP